MELTQEQLDIINSAGNIKINAVAGSGKTTTIIEYAKARPSDARILYIAFNRSVKLNAVKKFEEKGLKNIDIETAHSLAYKNVVFKHNYRVRSQSYKTHEIAEILGLTGNGEKHAEYIIANHINKFITYFCNSDKQKVKDLNYLDTVSDDKAKEFVLNFYPYIEQQSRIFLDKMNKGEIEIIHDFYLKKFQLSNPKLHYDYILFDEGQDASAAMLDIFLNQQATKVIVGDTHQQIYSWRYAVNSLEKTDFKTFHLSTSFRFSQAIGNLANNILQWKEHINQPTAVEITGKGSLRENKSKATLARTNLGLLLKAIEYIKENKKAKHIYFEGNINSYTYADEGTSLYDVLNLHEGHRDKIRDKLVKTMKNMEELGEYIEKTEDVQLAMMVEIVEEYGSEIYSIIKKIKDLHVEGDEKENAEMIFSTVHRCKGMEYDVVHLVNDFITEEKILNNETSENKTTDAKLSEEINLLYVAATRTKNLIHIPETIVPQNMPQHVQIRIIANKEKANNFKPFEKTKKKDKSYTVENVRKDYQTAYNPWSEDEDNELTIMYGDDIALTDLAEHFGRSKGAIASRIKKLNL